MKTSLYEYCMEHEREDLLREWHPTKNAPLTLQSLTYGSKRETWWRCEFGHEWQTRVYTRTTCGSGCPYCSGQKVFVGETDLATQKPDIAAQWHPTKNKELTPEQVSPGSRRKVWWICDKRHEWQATVNTRSGGAGCPICTNRVVLSGENDFATLYPLFAKEWHPEKNGSLEPNNVFSGSTQKVWWRCDKGHEWEAAINSRVYYNTGCPVCVGKVVIPGENDLASAYPELVEEWHPTKNHHLTPQELSPYSNRKIWWRCALGHEYTAVVSCRTYRGNGCPYCAGVRVLAGFNDLATLEPKVAARWHPTLNNQLTPDMVTVGSTKKVWWQCNLGHVWKAVVYSQRFHGCPVCAGRTKEIPQKRYLKFDSEEFYKQ